MLLPMARTGNPMSGSDRAGGFKGNKAALPSKPCTVCGRPMSWRKRWAANWDEVKVCSEACRRQRSAGGGRG